MHPSPRMRPAAAIVIACALAAVWAPPATAYQVQVVRTHYGTQSYQHFGQSLAAIGDFNGDGRPDYAAGNPVLQQVNLYFGGSHTGVPDFIIGAPGEFSFGAALAPAGDFNGDGHPDLLVGAHSSGGAAGAGAGVVRIYFGGPSFDGVPDVVLEGRAAGERFGSALEGGGDLDGDGFADVIAAAFPVTGPTQVRVYRGGATAPAAPALTIDGTAGDRPGTALAIAGDLDLDGFDDFLVGAATAGDSGRAMLFRGGPVLSAIPHRVWTGAAAQQRLGAGLAAGGDFDDDGYPDLAIVEPASKRIRVLAGGSDPGARPIVTLAGDLVAAGGDLNLDGADDLLVRRLRQVEIHFGGAAPDSIADVHVIGESTQGFGATLTGVGDTNGDLVPEFAVGTSHLNALGYTEIGRVQTLQLANLQVLIPAPGARWIAGVEQSVAWTGEGAVDVSYSPDSGQTWTVLAEGAGGSGSPVIRVRPPGPATDRALLRLVVSGVPESPLSIRTVPLTVADVQFLSLDSYDWAPGIGRTMKWFGARPVDIEARRDGADWRILATQSGSADTSRVTFVPPADLYGELQLRIRVNGEPATPLSSSPAPAPARLPAFTLLEPRAADLWRAGETGRIQWRGGAPTDIDAQIAGRPETRVPLARATGGAATNELLVDVPGFEGEMELELRVPGEAAGPLTSAKSPVFHVCSARAGIPAAELRFAVNGSGQAPHLGTSVATAGDLNGDGLTDYCAGAPEGGPSRRGEVMIWLGGPGDPGAPDLVLRGSQNGERFGATVTGIGDLNGDGYDDLAVGSPSFSLNSFTVGRVQVYLGGPAMDPQADAAFSGPVPNFSLLGSTLSAIGDYDGDGFDDFAAASVLTGASGALSYVNIYLGAADASRFTPMNLTVTSPLNAAGTALTAVGDWDGDGRDDLAVGSPIGTGKVEVYGFPSRVLARMVSTVANDGLGTAIALLRRAPAGEDLLAVSAPSARPGQNVLGEVVLYGRDGLERGRLRLPSLVQLGAAIDGSADFDGDGVRELLLGAPGGTFQAGEVYLWSGRQIESPCKEQLVTLRADRAGTSFGTALAFVSFADGPFPVVLVGAPNHPDGQTGLGRVELHRLKRPRLVARPHGRTFHAGEIDTIRWSGADPVDISLSADDGATWTTVFEAVGGAGDNALAWIVPPQPAVRARLRVSWSGQIAYRANADVSPPFRIAPRIPVSRFARRQRDVVHGAAPGERAGSVLARMPDVDGDGIGELVVGAPDADLAAGRVTLHLSRGAVREWRGAAPGDRFGAALHATHDLDADGRADLVIGAPGHGSIAVRAGRVYVFGGGEAGAPDLVIDGAAHDEAGTALCAIDDLNQIGVTSLAVGAPGTGGGTGSVRVYLGSPAFDAQADVVIAGTRAAGRFGGALAGGDVNGDGRADLAIGAPLAGGFVPGTGEVVVYCAPLVTGVAPWFELAGTAPFEALGSALAAGSDLDADGFGDLAIGSPGRTGAVVDGGRVTVVFGGPYLDAGGALHIDGSAAGERLGTAVAMPGDMDGDGVADLAAGAPFRAPADAGAVQVHRGAPRMSATPEFVVVGTPGDRLGAALAPAGDPAGPGFHDLFVAAPFANGAGPDAGRVDVIDMERYFLLQPNGGELWQAGTNQVVEWLGDEPAEVQLSLDGGRTYQPLAGALVRTRVTVRAPSATTRQARVRLIAADRGRGGSDASDADFEIRTAVRLVRFDLEVEADGAHLAWETDPPPGPEGIRGYRLVRRSAAGTEIPLQAGADVTTATAHVDAESRPGAEYVLSALDATGQWIELGRQRVPGIEGLRAGPLPWRGDGALRVAFEAPVGVAGFTAADLEVALFDAAGREVATLARGPLEARAGIVQLEWSGHLASGARASPGIYFLRARAPSAGLQLTRRIAIVR